MAIRATTPTGEQEKSVFFADRGGNLIPGTIVRESQGSPLYPLELELRPNADSPAPSETSLSSSFSIMRFAAVTSLMTDKVGSLFLSIRKDCYEGKTERFVWIDQLDHLGQRELKHIGTAFLEKTIEESLKLGLDGRVKVMAIAGDHMFYLSSGFVPEKMEYAYSDSVAITRFLKRLFASKEPMQQAIATYDPLWNKAREILAFEHKKPFEEIDGDYIRSHWYWDENYPLKPSMDCTPWIEKVKEAALSPRHYITILPPMMLHLPEKSLEIWKKIMVTPIENHDERHALFQELGVQYLS
ncbi:MAG: hypothetical protein JSR39_02040 [Verrucomicrobia bacterium]|nr:hypothetical protein [Verrucomicrobiota bacterium]